MPVVRGRFVALGVFVVGVCAALGVSLVAWTSTSQPAETMRLTFDSSTSLASGTSVPDESGSGHSAVVTTAKGGTLTLGSGSGGEGRSAVYPRPCGPSSSCPRAILETPDHPDLDPGTAAFDYGASLRMTSAETSGGANVLQKGYYGTPGGQWKLQVDGSAGAPSCVLAGVRNGSVVRTKVLSSVSVADGSWHMVRCRRDAHTVTILVDGVVRGQANASLGTIANAAPLRVGGKDIASWDNDQFHGALDDVHLSFG